MAQRSAEVRPKGRPVVPSLVVVRHVEGGLVRPAGTEGCVPRKAARPAAAFAANSQY